jgi:hypothetical protein
MKIPKKFIKTIFCFLMLSFTGTLISDNRIVIPLKHLPEEEQLKIIKKYKKSGLNKKLEKFERKTPGQVSKKLFKNRLKKYLTPKLSGFTAVYAGYMDVSDPDGYISFPMRHEGESLSVAVTPEIKMAYVKGHTFSHKEFILDGKNPLEIYTFEKKEDEDNQLFWKITKAEMPQEPKIKSTTLIILTKPKNLFVLEGDRMTVKNVQLVLPSIYVIGSEGKEQTLLRLIDVKRYFENIKVEKKRATDSSIQRMIVNL